MVTLNYPKHQTLNSQTLRTVNPKNPKPYTPVNHQLPITEPAGDAAVPNLGNLSSRGLGLSALGVQVRAVRGSEV